MLPYIPAPIPSFAEIGTSVWYIVYPTALGGNQHMIPPRKLTCPVYLSLLESSTCQMLCIPYPQVLVIGRNKLYKLMKTVKIEALKHASFYYVVMVSGIDQNIESTDSHSHTCHSNEALSGSGYINKSTKTPWVCGHSHSVDVGAPT